MTPRLLVAAFVALAPVAAHADASAMVRGACTPRPAGAAPVPAPQLSRANALALLGSVTQLDASARGRALLDSNLATTLAINAGAAPVVRRLALRDAQVTAANAFTLADGLGETMGDAYRRKATFTSADDGKTVTAGQVGPAVGDLFKAAGVVSSGDSGEAKCAFANGVEPFEGGTYVPPPGGVLDVIGRVYHLPAGAPGGDRYGNPRPFQVAPPDGRGPNRIAIFEGTDFFGVPMSSRIVLFGASAADKAAGRFAYSLADSPSFPSGHTTFGFSEALLLAMMVPERYQALVYRASEYGHSRIVLGAHYPIDVVAGRTLATYDLAQDLAGKPGYAGDLLARLAAGARELRAYLQASGCPKIALCAREPIERASDASRLVGGATRRVSPADAYAFRLDYGLAPLGSTHAPPEAVPAEAERLLATRFPYLTPAQRGEVLRTTQGSSGHFLDIDPASGATSTGVPGVPAAQVGAYARLDLFAAAGGYATFADRVVVDQDRRSIGSADLQPFADFAALDTWSNDIDGDGGLTKRGSGRLVLTGTDTYAGATRIEEGTLEVAGSLSSSTTVEAGGTLAGAGRLATVAVRAGATLAPGAGDGGGATMDLAGSLTLARGSTFVVASAGPEPLLSSSGRAVLDAPNLSVAVKLKAGDRLVLVAARGGVSGRFGPVVLTDPTLDARLDYADGSVTMTIVPKSATKG